MSDTLPASGPGTPAPSAPAASPTATPAASGTPTLTPAPTGQPGTPTPPSGEPPHERWADILENTRKKMRAEVEQESRQRYSKYDQFEQDPWAAVQDWLSQATQHSLYGPVVKQWIQEQGRAGQSPVAATPEPKPDVPIANEQGQITGYTYSDKALREWQQWNEQRLLGRLEERFGSLEQHNAQRAAHEERTQLAQEAWRGAGDVLQSLRQQPYFAQHEPKIRQALVDHPEWGDNVHAAFNYVLTTDILPTLSQAEQRQVVDSLTGKAAGTTVAPGSTAPGAPKFKSFKAAAQYYEQHPDEAAAMAKR